MSGQYLYTAESVGRGHPDKVCDQISDAVLDAVIKNDPTGRVACKTFCSMGMALVGGEITTKSRIDVVNIARNVLLDIGYDRPQYGFNAHSCSILNGIHQQSPDISQGVDKGGAGDQGIMCGYACNETKELMPLPIMLAHRLVERIEEVRTKNILKYLGPDCKSQVTVEYKDDIPVRVDSIVLACQHTEEILDQTGENMTSKSKNEILEAIVYPVLGKLLDKGTRFHINGTGKFLIGGPQADTGLTGCKLMVDNYGPDVPHGGGAFSGKDPTKVDRCAAYMGRYIAKNIVAAGLATKCFVQLAYAIGYANPVSIRVNTFGTGNLSDAALLSLIKRHFSLTPQGIIKMLSLRRPIYGKTAVYGHFGRSDFSWERTDRARMLQEYRRSDGTRRH